MQLSFQPSMTAQVERQLRNWIAGGESQGSTGAFHAWRDAKSGRLSYAYPEITGIALTYLASLHNQQQQGSPVTQRAAEWLQHRVATGNLNARDKDGSTIYNFDLAMMASGLLNIGQTVGSEPYVLAGLKLAELLRNQILAQGKLTAINGSRSPMTRTLSWSTDGSAHLLKVVQCLLIAESLGASRAEEAAALLMSSADNIQASNGRLKTQPLDSETWLHPVLYGAEGLWIWGHVHRDWATLERAAAAVNWVWSYQLPSGGFPCVVDHDGHRATGPEQSDVTCQAVRLTLLLGMTPPGLMQSLVRIVESAYIDGASAAIVYRPSTGLLHLNSWCSIFGAQALALLKENDNHMSWSDLA